MTNPSLVTVGRHALPGILQVDDSARGIVLFAHGSGSSRLSPRNAHAAARLRKAGFGTLLFDLLTEYEALDRRKVFDIPLLGARVADAVRWVLAQPGSGGLPIGLFGASTGAAAALVCAATMPETVAAVVSRGGRPDLAGPWLADVRAPTLLIVGAADTDVLALNRQALAGLRCAKRLDVIAGATHLFEEGDTLDAALDAAAGWFERYLGACDETVPCAAQIVTAGDVAAAASARAGASAAASAT